ncbi:MAG: glycosyltransferase [Phycisphaeraceae bacterium]|nr:glycosyltransferase [Phycisphaeraceae bacterium]MBX3368085.1 glycosyltransferase [Phycisphaeraceae bacterium]
MSLRHSVTPSLAYVLPTRNRPEVLARTLAALGALPRHDAEVIIVDNDSDRVPQVARELANGIPVRLIRMDENAGAAARNVGVHASDPSAAWIVMLDDDSHPISTDFVGVLGGMAGDVLAVSADIHLPAERRREDGGLPEVFIGCGVAVRRDAFLASGGYDHSFNYYAEEYDLAARLMLMGGRVVFEHRFVVHHHKVTAGRDKGVILGRLIRNNGWVTQRYAPEERRRAELRNLRQRYRGIAIKERATEGFGAGLVELRRTIRGQTRRAMPVPLHDRFTGAAQALEAVRDAMWERAFRTAAIICRGKNDWAVERALFESGVSIACDPSEADALVIGTMSPGPMIDAAVRAFREFPERRVLTPWLGAGVRRVPGLAA